jgi:hypothetical protein
MAKTRVSHSVTKRYTGRTALVVSRDMTKILENLAKIDPKVSYRETTWDNGSKDVTYSWVTMEEMDFFDG